MACAIILIAVVMLQPNRGGNINAVFGMNGNNSGRGKSASRDMFLKRATVISSVVFVVIVLVMNIVSVAF